MNNVEELQKALDKFNAGLARLGKANAAQWVDARNVILEPTALTPMETIGATNGERM